VRSTSYFLWSGLSEASTQCVGRTHFKDRSSVAETGKNRRSRVKNGSGNRYKQDPLQGTLPVGIRFFGPGGDKSLRRQTLGAKSESRLVMSEHGEAARRAVPHPQVHTAGLRATPQVTRLALTAPSIRRKRHESAMSIVMGSD